NLLCHYTILNTSPNARALNSNQHTDRGRRKCFMQILMQRQPDEFVSYAFTWQILKADWHCSDDYHGERYCMACST
ncbi:hypothetical protein FA840_018130, partial [Escherichia coli]|nr:hypothetical protein [Escherichia coli]